MIYKFNHNKHLKYLEQLPKISVCVLDIKTLYSPLEFRETLLKKIIGAQKRICIPVLYLENDQSGHKIVQALCTARKNSPEIDISILVDWHRAQRKRIGITTCELTNAHWYNEIAEQYPDIEIPIYGVPVNTREALGVLHLKGFIIDDMLLYSGASINDVYLHQYDKYRYDRYHLIHNSELANIMYDWICKNLKESNAVYRLDQKKYSSLESKKKTRQFRQCLRGFHYQFTSKINNKNLTLTPLVGLGKKNLLNRTIFHLMLGAKYKLIFCTPYFNLPLILVRNIIHLLNKGKKIEIIVGDKSANDFYIPPDKPFQIISTLPYLYEIKLRHFLTRLQHYILNEQLIVRLWKHGNNSYHLKGIWVDDEWMMITGNNLNPRAWRLDLENAILIHDPLKELLNQQRKELNLIRKHTTVIKHFQEIESISNYPIKVRKLIRRLRRVRIDHLISRLI